MLNSIDRPVLPDWEHWWVGTHGTVGLVGFCGGFWWVAFAEMKVDDMYLVIAAEPHRQIRTVVGGRGICDVVEAHHTLLIDEAWSPSSTVLAYHSTSMSSMRFAGDRLDLISADL
jgi:hypothetical protein